MSRDRRLVSAFVPAERVREIGSGGEIDPPVERPQQFDEGGEGRVIIIETADGEREGEE
jgi:hypothetical protein